MHSRSLTKEMMNPNIKEETTSTSTSTSHIHKQMSDTFILKNDQNVGSEQLIFGLLNHCILCSVIKRRKEERKKNVCAPFKVNRKWVARWLIENDPTQTIFISILQKPDQRTNNNNNKKSTNTIECKTQSIYFYLQRQTYNVGELEDAMTSADCVEDFLNRFRVRRIFVSPSPAAPYSCARVNV